MQRTQLAVNNVDPLVLVVRLDTTEADILALTNLRRAARCGRDETRRDTTARTLV